MADTLTEPCTVVIHIPMAPPAALSPNNRGSRHWRFRQQAAHELRTVAYLATKTWLADHAYTVPLNYRDMMYAIHEHIVWPKSKGVLPDPDSLATFAKSALDGIVDSGIIAGDSAKHIASVSTSQEKGTDKTGQIVITIQEITP